MKLSLFTLITLVSIISSQIAPGSQPTNPVVDPTNITAPVDDPKANRVRPPSIIIGQNLTAPLRMGPFSLKNWGFLQLPGSINLGRGQSLTSVYNPKLSNGYQNAYFYVSPLGDAYVFNTVIGTIRAVYWEGSIYARTELSETDSTNGTASWDATTGVHNFEVTQSVNAFTSFVSGKVIVMEMKSNLCPQCVDFYLKADAHSNPNGATLTAFFPQASNPTKPLKYVVDTNVQIGVKYQARLLVSNGRMHFYYNKVEYTPIEGIQTNDTSAFFKFGSWAQSRPHDNDPAGSFDQVWTYSATASHTTTSGNDIGAQQVIPNIPGVVGQQAKSGSISNTIGLLSILEIGAGLTASGVFFMLLGVILLFDGGLLAIGNILFLSGLTLVIGFQKTIVFFARKQKIKGTICFLTGIILVFARWPVIGMGVELFGFINLFGDFFPVVISFLRRLPIIGNILNLPGISMIVNRISGSRLPV